MTTQAEAAQTLRDVAALQRKTVAEIGTLQTTITTLRAKIEELQQTIAQAPQNVSDDLATIVAEVRNLAQQADEQIPDLQAPAPDEESGQGELLVGDPVGGEPSLAAPAGAPATEDTGEEDPDKLN